MASERLKKQQVDTLAIRASRAGNRQLVVEPAVWPGRYEVVQVFVGEGTGKAVGGEVFRGSLTECGVWLIGYIKAADGGWVGAKATDAQREAYIRAQEARRKGARKNPVWTQKYIDELPDTAFLIVDKSCAKSKDKRGRSHPLSCRHLPYKDKGGNVNKAHLKAAIGRAPQTTSVPVKMRKAAQAKARKLYEKLYG